MQTSHPQAVQQKLLASAGHKQCWGPNAASISRVEHWYARRNQSMVQLWKLQSASTCWMFKLSSQLSWQYSAQTVIHCICQGHEPQAAAAGQLLIMRHSPQSGLYAWQS